VGALALAVLVAAMWDSGKKKPASDAQAHADATADGATVDGALGGVKPTGTGATLAPPQPTASATEKPQEKIVEEFAKYTVGKKETLRSIAKKWLHDEARWKELLEQNKDHVMDPDHLHQGLTLVFPKSKLEPKGKDEGGDAASTVPGGFKKGEMKTDEMPAGDRKYVVKSGDTLYAIAVHELGKGSRWKEIVKINNLPGDTVRKGQTLILPPR
jgi:nucleoid-associated protein YgaU